MTTRRKEGRTGISGVLVFPHIPHRAVGDETWLERGYDILVEAAENGINVFVLSL